jgi:hypothetical protein
MSMRTSLFIVSLPRSLSSVVHDRSASALGLRSPTWTSAGEILNGERLAVSGAADGPRFTPPENRFLYEQLCEFLDAVVEPAGYCYKDVVQPFVVSGWLRDRELRVLRIERSISDIAWSMIRAGWHYPAAGGAEREDKVDQVLQGLISAHSALERLPGETIKFDEFVFDEQVLTNALQRLYPNTEIPPIHFIDAQFSRHRDDILRRRDDSEWKEIQMRIRALESRLSP